MYINRCIESNRQYDTSRFNYNVCTEFGFKDHNPPSMKLILAFCQHVETQLNLTAEKTIVVNCKAGKVSYFVFLGNKDEYPYDCIHQKSIIMKIEMLDKW